jgi:hypothetical protein
MAATPSMSKAAEAPDIVAQLNSAGKLTEPATEVVTSLRNLVRTTTLLWWPFSNAIPAATTRWQRKTD